MLRTTFRRIARRPLGALGASFAIALASGCGSGDETEPATAATASPETAAPTEAADATQDGLLPTEAGRYRVGLRPRGGDAPIGALHEWVVTVERADGTPFTPQRILVDGGMPQHGHGFITQPRVTRALSPNSFLIEGMKFHMGGDWVLRVDLVGEDGPDTVTMDVHVAP